MGTTDELRHKYEARLKPCPCCGGEHLVMDVTHIVYEDEVGEVYCRDCDLTMYGGSQTTEEDALIAAMVKWNWRNWSPADRHGSVVLLLNEHELAVAEECNKRLHERRMGHNEP